MTTRFQYFIENLKEEPWEDLNDVTINIIFTLMEQLNHNNGYFYNQDKRLLLWGFDNGAILDVKKIKNLLIKLNASFNDIETLIDVCIKINSGIRVRPPKNSIDEFTKEYKQQILTENFGRLTLLSK
jgi:hypothetical protein